MGAKQEYLQQLIDGVSNDTEDHKLIIAGKDAAMQMTNYLNTFSHDERIATFIGAMRLEHRTLQQNFTSLCIGWIRHLSTASDYDFDGRNEASQKLAKKIMSLLAPEDQYLPFI